MTPNDPIRGWTREQRQIVADWRRARAEGRSLGGERAVLLDAIDDTERSILALYGRGLSTAFRPRSTGAPPSSRSLKAVLIKPVSDHCNLRCTYCYEGEGSDRQHRGVMSASVLEALIRDTLTTAEGDVQFLWHGGEPLLAGLDLFRKGLEFQAAHATGRGAVRNGVQTNGTLLDRAWIAFFRDHDFSVGLSLDGPPDLHDAARVAPGGTGTHQAVAGAIQRLREGNLPFGVIAVIGDAHVGRAREVLAHFRDLGVSSIDVHPSFGMARTSHDAPLSPRKFADFVIDLFDAWLSRGERGIRVNVFQELLRVLLGEAPRTCYHAGACTSIVAVEADGDVVPCTRPFDRMIYTFGNLRRQSLTTVFHGARLQAFAARDLASQERSLSCPWYSICHNGCPQHRINADGLQDVAGANLYCRCQSGQEGGNAAIWEHLTRRIDEVLRAG